MNNLLETPRDMLEKGQKYSKNDVFDLFDKQQKHALLLRVQPVAARKKLLKDFERFLLKNVERINEGVHADFRKPFVEVELSELYPVITEIRHAVANLDDWASVKKADAPLTYLGTRSEISYEPKGVCLILSPWNFPLNLCFGPLISCLAAGNTAILKPSELTPSASSLIAELVSEFFDENLVAVVQGGAAISTELLKLPFDHIFFTGSPAVGKIVMKAAAENLSSVTLELGGKSPVIIDKTANLRDAARRIAFGKFLNNGQTCIAPDYVLAEKDIATEFVGELKKSVISLFGVDGNIDENSSSYARIVNQKNFERISHLQQDAITRGAKLEWGGATNIDTRFMHPSILSGVTDQMEIMHEEIFGPVLPVVVFSTVAEVVRAVNSRPKPLALYIFSHDRKFRKEILTSTSSGSVCINDCVIQFSHPNLPFGGTGNSGLGKSHGYYGFLAFSNEKPVVKQRRGVTALYLVYPPYTKKVKRIIDLMVKWF